MVMCFYPQFYRRNDHDDDDGDGDDDDDDEYKGISLGSGNMLPDL